MAFPEQDKSTSICIAFLYNFSVDQVSKKPTQINRRIKREPQKPFKLHNNITKPKPGITQNIKLLRGKIPGKNSILTLKSRTFFS